MSDLDEEARKQYIKFILRDLRGLNYNDAYVGLLEETFDLYEKQKNVIDKMADEILDLYRNTTPNDSRAFTVWLDKEHILSYFCKELYKNK